MSRSASTLTAPQIKAARAAVRDDARGALMLELSLSAALRAKEVAALDWEAVDLDTGTLRLTATKGDRFRVVPIKAELRAAFVSYGVQSAGPVFPARRDPSTATDANAVTVWFHRLFAGLGFKGASSHSGRRTFITTAARKASLVGASLRDVQSMVGHSDLRTTQRYIDTDADAQRRLVELI
ncbi:MAG: site-specific integrase [Hyphomicrobium sp.]|nr:site-specific integrase [Hyphomicrobium sp.]